MIVSGQVLDLERFGPAKEGGKISALGDNEQMDDYTYRVAGCGSILDKDVACSFDKMSPTKEEEFFEKGIRFGKALQMINILRIYQRILDLAGATYHKRI